MLKFLGVPDDGRSDFPAYNSAKTVKWPRVTRTMFLLTQIKQRFGITLGMNLWTFVESINRIEADRDPLAPEILIVLTKYFRNDIALLAQLLNKDLRLWLS